MCLPNPVRGTCNSFYRYMYLPSPVRNNSFYTMETLLKCFEMAYSEISEQTDTFRNNFYMKCLTSLISNFCRSLIFYYLKSIKVSNSQTHLTSISLNCEFHQVLIKARNKKNV